MRDRICDVFEGGAGQPDGGGLRAVVQPEPGHSPGGEQPPEGATRASGGQNQPASLQGRPVLNLGGDRHKIMSAPEFSNNNATKIKFGRFQRKVMKIEYFLGLQLSFQLMLIVNWY